MGEKKRDYKPIYKYPKGKMDQKSAEIILYWGKKIRPLLEKNLEKHEKEVCNGEEENLQLALEVETVANVSKRKISFQQEG